MRAVFLDIDTLDCGDLSLDGLKGAVESWQAYASTAPDQLVERLNGAEIAISNKVVLDAEALRACPSLKLICVAATGYNNVDLQAAREQGVVVCNVRGYSTPSVVQQVFAMLLGLCRKLPQYHQAVNQGRWQQSEQFCLLDYQMTELNGKTLGIVGYGALGQAVAKVAECFGMRVLLAQRPGGEPQPGRLPLAEILPQLDVLSLHCPLTAETRGLIGKDELASMKPGAMLINTARGGIVDEAALAGALRSGHLAGAGVDVLAQEPPVADNPLLASDLTNLIMTPHIAWASVEARQRLTDELQANIVAFNSGEPRNVVN